MSPLIATTLSRSMHSAIDGKLRSPACESTTMHRIKIELTDAREAVPIPIVSDAAMGTVGIAEGRIIPVLIVDTTLRPDIDDLVRAHEHLGPGDARSAFGPSGV